MSRARRAAERKGRFAEAVAAFLLTCKGYRILARRYRTPVGEVDLIARRGRRLAFVEVKLRESAGAAAHAVTPRQQHRIARAAEHWLAQRAPQGEWEAAFDVVLVAPWSWPRHLKSAFRI
jgi:putative endonuclease